MSKEVGLGSSAIYDPYGEKQIEFWENQLALHPDKVDMINGYIDDSRIKSELLKSAKKSGRDYDYPLATTVKMPDEPREVFVHGLPEYLESDDDVGFVLRKEKCHVDGGRYEVDMPEGAPLNDIYAAMDEIQNDRDLEEARCYSDVFSSVLRGDLRILEKARVKLLPDYEYRYNVLQKKAIGDTVRAELYSLLVKSFVNPSALK